MKANYGNKGKHNQTKSVINKLVYCDECKYEFSLSTVNIDEATVKVGRQVLKLVYFVCPKCNKIYRITLKDERYEELKEDLEKTKSRMRKIYGSGNGEFASTLNLMVIKKLERLNNHVDNLNKKYPGTFTFVTSENNNEGKFIKYLP